MAAPHASRNHPPALNIAETILHYRPAKTFQLPVTPKTSNSRSDPPEVTCLDFDDQGEYCIASTSDETLQLYDCKLGKFQKTLYSKKYGVHLAKFTHSNSQVIYASTKEDDTLRYLSLHDNSYIRYFRGHKGKVTTLEFSPVDEHFLSGSLDGTVRIWDLRSQSVQGSLSLSAPHLVAFDPMGIIFAVACHRDASVYLYDARNFDRSPFATFRVEDNEYLNTLSYPPTMPKWSKLEFTNDGKRILLGTKGLAHYVLDSYNGQLINRLHRNAAPRTERETSGDCCFSPDARYVVGGDGQKNLVVWDTFVKPEKGLSLWPVHGEEYAKDAAGVVVFNPRHALIATANKEVAFWLPNMRSTSPPDSPR
ncbi:WD40 repeat-like protein [Ascobolus immersus RN42]|uniref:WD40 repeat-like protein n=1 Tax=Ascobolus immersus RN42 TaxID=1160509 RepID=A0A3N4INK1_ASCIM|nr:WD40 repeat-like protein [Ascobolus immersus RN42]